MKQFLILLALGICAYGQTGLGHSTITCKDIDGDGYGVGPGCLGPDSDDSDATIHSAAQTISKWGSINAFLIGQNYQSAISPSTVWCISTTGNNSTGAGSTNADTACTTPFLTWAGMFSHLATPYIVIFRGGTYTGQQIQGMPSGTSTQQNVIMSYPGEQAVIDYSAQVGAAFLLGAKSYVTVDGFKILSNASGSGYAGGTYILYGTGSQTITFVGDVLRRCEISGGGGDSNVDADNLTNFTVEENVIHDPATSGQHNIYLGSNTVASSGVVVRWNILYNVHTGGYPNLQFNGRCLNCYFEGNILYNADQQEIAWLNGVSNSFLRNNLVFNTGSNGGLAESFTLTNGNNTSQCQVTGLPSICSWDQTNNVIENNTFWAGTQAVYGSGTVSGPTVAILNSQLTTGPCGNGGSPPCGNLGGNFYRNNIIVGAGPVNHSANSGTPPVTYENGNSPNYLASDTWTNNIIMSQDASTYIMGFGQSGNGYNSYNCVSIATLALSSSGCSTASPDFVSVSTSFYSSPSSFNFALQPGSPAIGAGTATGAPTYDLWGTTRANPPSIGAYEPINGCSIAPTTLGPWTIGQTINQTFTNGGCNSSTWSSSGTWPAGLTFSTSTGISSGTISGSSGAFTPSVGYGTATNNYSITVNAAPSITTSSPLPNGTVGTAYSQSLTASGGTPPLTWSVNSGAVPPGTTLSSAGLLSGTPTTATGSPFSFTALVTDSNSVTANATFSVTNAASSGSSPSGSVGVTDLSNTQLQNACPPNNGTGGPNASYANYPFNSLCAAQYNAWSSGVIDTTRHRLILMGGGHSDYHGNEVYSLNYAANPPTLTRITNPDPWCNIGMVGNTDTSYCGVTTLAAPITSSSASSISVTSSSTFPPSTSNYPSFVVFIDSEQMLVTAASGTTWTVTRGYNSTTAATHSSGATVTTPGIGDGNTVCPITAPWGCFKNIPNNTPVATHAFGCVVYMPTQDAIFYGGGGGYPSGSVRPFTWWLQFYGSGSNLSGSGSATWIAKDTVTATGTPAAAPIGVSPDTSGYMCTYDSLDDTVIMEGIGESQFLWKYNPATNTYANLNQSAFSRNPIGGMEAAFDPVHNKLWLMGGNGDPPTAFKAGYVDMSGAGGYTYVDESSTLSGTCGEMFSSTTAFPGFEWDPIQSKFVGYPSAGNTIYIFDPVQLSCTAEILAGYAIPAIPVISPPSGVFGKFRYTPDIPGNFVFCGGGGVTADCVSMQVEAASQTATPSSCDLNGDGRVNVLDVQIAIDQYLGIIPCTTAALTGNGQCTTTDVQRVVNAALGGACVIGP